jgi:chaperonin GroEL (HSP60 family)
MLFDRGYLSPDFVTDPQKMECELEELYVLIYEKKVSCNKDLVPVLERGLPHGKPILSIAEEVAGEALATLGIDKLRAAPLVAFGQQREQHLHLLPALLHVALVVQQQHLVAAQPLGQKQAIQGRIQAIQLALDKSTSRPATTSCLAAWARATSGPPPRAR